MALQAIVSQDFHPQLGVQKLGEMLGASVAKPNGKGQHRYYNKLDVSVFIPINKLRKRQTPKTNNSNLAGCGGDFGGHERGNALIIQHRAIFPIRQDMVRQAARTPRSLAIHASICLILHAFMAYLHCLIFWH